jgi:hypothetical protein
VFERFSDRARLVLVLAREEAAQLGQPFLGTEHILLGLLREGRGLGGQALESLGVTLDAVRREVQRSAEPSEEGSGVAQPPFTSPAKKLLELSLREALRLGSNDIGTEHLLLGLVEEREGTGHEILESLGAGPDRVREKVLELEQEQGQGEPADPRPLEQGTNAPMARRFAPIVAPGPVAGGVRQPGPRAFVSPFRFPPGTCALCGRDLWEVEHYVTAGDIDVCDQCIDVAHRALDEATGDERQLLLPPRVFGDAAYPEAVSDVVEAVVAVFRPGGAPDLRARHMEDFDELQPLLARAGQHPVAVSASTVSVSRIRFIGSTTAEVRLGIGHAGRGTVSFDGRLRRHDDVWKVTRETVVQVLAGAGIQVPPRA